MRGPSFQEALDDPETPFRQFVLSCVDLSNRAVLADEAAGSPEGPAEDGDNVTRWLNARMDQFEALKAAEDLLFPEPE